MSPDNEPMNDDVLRDITPDGLSGERIPDDVTDDVPAEDVDSPEPVESPPDIRPGPC